VRAQAMLYSADYIQWVLKPENSLVWHKEVLGWLNKYSGIAAEQEGQEELVAGVASVDIDIV